MKNPDVLQIACIVPAKSVQSPAEICSQFQARLQKAFPDMGFVLAEVPEDAAITLELNRLSLSGVEGRILWSGRPDQPPLGMAIADSKLTPEQIGAFLDQLIAGHRDG